jgi:hypothetical protein
MNNKYQEALNKIKNKLTTVEYLQPLQATNKPTTFQEAFERAEGIEMTIECEEELKTLQELVNKATPKKVYFLNYGGYKIGNWHCTMCEKIIHKGEDYCINCGQKLDWSEENGKGGKA